MYDIHIDTLNTIITQYKYLAVYKSDPFQIFNNGDELLFSIMEMSVSINLQSPWLDRRFPCPISLPLFNILSLILAFWCN